MKRAALFTIALLFLSKTILASPVSVTTAREVAIQFLVANEPRVSTADIVICDTWLDANGTATMYVFNIGAEGFIIVSADDEVPPIVGYSLNGTYNRNRIPDNLRGWLEGYSSDVDAYLSSTSKEGISKKDQQQWSKEWDALRNKDIQFYATKSGDTVNALVETRWDQGTGYNDYCPEWSEAYNGRCVTGCVATAMAQIIRYHCYPNVGFYHHSYSHRTYGELSADFDSAYYDFSQMPIRVNSYSSAAQRHAVSLLCYHCGVAVDMEYENPNHTTGSGAHSNDVPNALKYFGYTNSIYMAKGPATNGIWDSVLHHDLKLGRPVYYSGSSNSGGHAFVCDGYRGNKYHFNFGWSGSGDGFYSLSSVNGFSSNQACVFNIVPCGLGANLDTIYIASDGTGNGSSWRNANPNLEAALKIRGMYKSGQIWVKSGTYYGDTNSTSAFTFMYGTTTYGGFNGTEQSINERQAGNAPSILSGRGERQVATLQGALSHDLKIYNMTFADGMADNASAITVREKATLEFCTFENNNAGPDGAAVYVDEGSVINSIIRNNMCGGLIMRDGNTNNNLIVHNNAFGANVTGGTMTNCDMVGNHGYGLISDGITIRNCIMWNNDMQVSDSNRSNFRFCAIEGFDNDSNSNIGLSQENRPLTGNGPFFMNPDTTRGPAAVMGDWQLSSLSPLVDAGDTVRSGVFIRDIEGNNRFRNGRVDIGCYEHDPNVGIDTPEPSTALHAYPNPASTTLTIESAAGTIQMFDIMGRLLLTANATDGQTRLDISHLPNGIYLLRTETTTTKIIKKL